MSIKSNYVSNETELNDKQEAIHQNHMEEFTAWMRRCGMEPEKKEPLAESTAKNYRSRVKSLFEWVWAECDYTTRLEIEHADAYAKMLSEDAICKSSGEAYAGSSKRKETNALEKYFEWLAHEQGGKEWECDYDYEENSTRTRDYLLKDERRTLRDAVLDYGTVPAYNDLSPNERDRWKAHIAQKLGKPKNEVSPSDWDHLNTSWKWVSLVWTALDAGLRPCEVERAKISWFRRSKGELHIPRDESSKNREDWEVALSGDTVNALSKWLKQRSNIQKYDENDAMWLNRQGNPYRSKPLNYHLRKLLDLSEIGDENRTLSWYSIRHSTGTYLNESAGLAATGAQLRHKNLETTRQYIHPPTDTRRKALEGI